ncbi:hypothetical protein HOM13_01995 [Candidatus Woesearchaeota archaeon]|jgi:hypothetical protein|nr:hypothetical protein [Candidatus Woesearchaeota archaeon]
MEDKKDNETLSPTSRLNQTFSKGENTFTKEGSVKYPQPLGDIVDVYKQREESWRRLKDERKEQNTKES